MHLVKQPLTGLSPTVSDNCGGTLTLTSTKNPGTLFNLGTTPVTYTATDAAGNTSTCSFNVIVQDNTGPVIAGCPANITVNADASCQATVSWTAPTVSDNCGGTVTLTSTKNPRNRFRCGDNGRHLHSDGCRWKYINLFVQRSCSRRYESSDFRMPFEHYGKC